MLAHTCLQNSLMEEFSNSGLNYNCCLLTVGINTVTVFKNSEQSLKIFESHSNDFYGMPHFSGNFTLLSIESLKNLVSYLQMSCSEVAVVPFKIKGVLISDCQPDLESVQKSQKNEELPSNEKNNPKQLVNRNRECSGETADIREKRLIARCEYEKKRKANESEEPRQKRLAQQHENKRKNHASGSVESRRKRLASHSLYQKEKKIQMNLLSVDNIDCQTNFSIRKKKI